MYPLARRHGQDGGAGPKEHDLKVLGAVATRVLNEVKGVTASCTTWGPKPSGTIEWE